MGEIEQLVSLILVTSDIKIETIIAGVGPRLRRQFTKLGGIKRFKTYFLATIANVISPFDA